MTVPFGLVLAAGGSRRFGSPKALARFKGRTLIGLAIERLRTALGEQFAVVVGAHADVITPSLYLPPHQVLRQDDWISGQSASLRFGVAHLPRTSDATLITLVDQPLVTADDLGRLISTWMNDRTRAVAARYIGLDGSPIVGAPCILPRSWFTTVDTLEGDRGAGALLQTSMEVLQVSLQNAAYDIDTPEDLTRYG
ncbi:MAG: nucleotidyltransferase family protein [Gammaproteobacteria bacterium]|nr:nucleotidyltransferase family protein [Gammaproteobacteria bacterium]